MKSKDKSLSRVENLLKGYVSLPLAKELSKIIINDIYHEDLLKEAKEAMFPRLTQMTTKELAKMGFYRKDE